MIKAVYRRAMELERDGDWDAAHRLIQQYNTPEACLIHAFLHRIEGDEANAAYWYSRADEPFPGCSVDAERTELLKRLMD